ncbi:MAG TPA: hypothetical protein VNY51_00030 [Candidatus Dormibacteraeota bacterium]|nr:hypothetical protein [Candidatus Dormibacteraeota bacterium]
MFFAVVREGTSKPRPGLPSFTLLQRVRTFPLRARDLVYFPLEQLPSSIMGLVETSLEVVKLATKLATPELVQTATRANIEALELSGKNLELHRVAEELKARVKELETKLALVGEVFRDGDLVFREGELRGYCSRCWDVEHKLVHVVGIDRGRGAGHGNGCPECKTFFFHGHATNPRMK